MLFSSLTTNAVSGPTHLLHKALQSQERAPLFWSVNRLSLLCTKSHSSAGPQIWLYFQQGQNSPAATILIEPEQMTETPPWAGLLPPSPASQSRWLRLSPKLDWLSLLIMKPCCHHPHRAGADDRDAPLGRPPATIPSESEQMAQTKPKT